VIFNIYLFSKEKFWNTRY